MFGLYLQDSLAGYKSQLRIGGYNTLLMGEGGEESLVWHSISSKNSWALQLHDAKYGESSFKATGDTPI